MFSLPASRDRVLRDAEEEMRFHLAMWTEEFRAQGMSDEEARLRADQRFGNSDAYRAYADVRATRIARIDRVRDWFVAWTQDAGFALRHFRKAPMFTAIAVLTLALGIGANTAIFSVVHRLLLAPLPYPNGNRIVTPMTSDAHGMPASVPGSLVSAWAAHGTTVQDVALAYESIFSERADHTIDSIASADVSANFFDVLGVKPILGRAFTRQEETTADVVMIGYGLWQRDYAGRDDVLGKALDFEGKRYRIIGVLPREVAIPMLATWSRLRPAVTFPTPQVWKAIPREHPDERGGDGPTAFALLRPSATASQATMELQRVAANLAEPLLKDQRVVAMRAQDFIDASDTRGIQILFIAVGTLLLIACANVANLLLARAWVRRREFAVRIALGAGRGRLARQVLTESAVLGAMSGVVGVFIAWALLRVIVGLRPMSLEYLVDVTIQTPVLLWSAAVSIATGLLFGAAPALLASSSAMGDILRMETRTGSTGTTASRARSTLIVLEVTMSLVLLVGAGLLARSFVALQRMPMGFEPRELVFQDFLLGPRNRDRRAVILAAANEQLRAIPGVTDVSIGMMPGRGFLGGTIEAEIDANGGTTSANVAHQLISMDFFRTARIAFVEGHMLDSVGAFDSTWKRFAQLSSEVVISRSLARRLWPKGNALGSRLRSTEFPGEIKWSKVVGIVDDIRMPGITGDAYTLQLYSLLPPRFPEIPLLVRTRGSGDAITQAVKRTMMNVDRGLFLREPLGGETYPRESLAPARFAMALLATFAVIALALSSIGLYGVIAYSVSQRTREIGIRIALGATSRGIGTLVVSDGLRLVTSGIALGLLASIASTRSLRALLYGVSATDTATFVAITLLVMLIAFAASVIPARRATKIDPVEALRAD
jgi:predicted permease